MSKRCLTLGLLCILPLTLGYSPGVTDGMHAPIDPVYGDANADGIVSSIDASFVLQQAAGAIVFPNPAPKTIDVSGNGEITAYDSALILQYLAGIIGCFPADASCAK